MSKIACELCGTMYPDTEECCPTCGTQKPETAEFIPFTPEEETTHRTYTPTKGGRFSDANVRKRLSNKGAAPVPARAPRQERPQPRQERPQRPEPRQQKAQRPEPRQEQSRRPQQPRKQESSNTGLVITAVILLLAIIGMVVYIYVTFFAPTKPGPQQPEGTGSSQQQQQQQQLPIPQQTQGTTAAPDLSCTGLKLSEDSIRLNQVGGSWLLNVIPEPANTPDAISYVSADPSVATVTADGKVTAVASGETVITITCGDITAQCQVVCDIAPPTTAPQETTAPEETTAPSEAPTNFKLRKEDVSFYQKGETWLAYKGEIPLNKITWSTSNPNVATVNNGTVKAVGKGKCTIYAEYNGVTASCIIRCDF